MPSIVPTARKWRHDESPSRMYRIDPQEILIIEIEVIRLQHRSLLNSQWNLLFRGMLRDINLEGYYGSVRSHGWTAYHESHEKVQMRLQFSVQRRIPLSNAD